MTFSRRRLRLQGWRAPWKDHDGVKRCVGRSLNPNCNREIGHNRYKWCSQECVDFCMFLTHPGFARTIIFGRDAGVCAECGLDTEMLCRIIRHANNSYFGKRIWDMWYHRGPSDILWIHMRFNHRQSLWALDHIVPLSDGGSFLHENCQTLCVPCHKDKTKREATARAERSRKC